MFDYLDYKIIIIKHIPVAVKVNVKAEILSRIHNTFFCLKTKEEIPSSSTFLNENFCLYCKILSSIFNAFI